MSKTKQASPISGQVAEFLSRLGWRRWLVERPRRSTWLGAGLVYLICVAVFLAFAPRSLLSEHTQFNHFAHLAGAWLEGSLSLPDGPPAYAQNNDFARFQGKWFITFPPFPAVLLLPFVAWAGEPELVRDGQIFLWIAGLGPALLFVALERLRSCGHSERGPGQNLLLALCMGLGTVLFFTVEQGTVWFAAHVVAVVLAAVYLIAAIDASYPLLAGLAIGLGLMTRAPLVFAVPLFGLEMLRTCSADGRLPWTKGVTLRQFFKGLHWQRLLLKGTLFSLPILICLGVTFWHNALRFGDPFETGYRYLTVAWQVRMEKWGLFSYHYLAKNLGVVLTSLPWMGKGAVPFRINVHGLALWFTTPLYLWLLWPKKKPAIHLAIWATVAAVAIPGLLYQNTGWAQFGYRFSNDYAVFLFALLATGMRPMRGLFVMAAVWGLLVNGFGAATFGRAEARKFYFWQGSQVRIYQKD